MKKIKVIVISIFIILTLTGCRLKEKPAPVIEMKSFFKNGNKSSFSISPDGKYYAYMSDYKGKMNVFVQEIGKGDAIRVTSDTLRSIDGYFWKGGRIVYQQDIGGDRELSDFFSHI